MGFASLITSAACSPDERSEIRGGVRVVPDIVTLIRAYDLSPSYDRRTFTFSRRIAPEVCFITSRPLVQRAQGRPGARRTRGLACQCTRQKAAHEHTGSAETLRPSPRNGFTAYFVLFPENGFLASVVGGTLPAYLTPAPRRPNHTTSPYASGAHVYRAVCVHRISPRVRDDGQRPSSAVRRAY